HRLGQGPARAPGGDAPRAAQRTGASDHADRPAGAVPDRRRRDHRDDLRHPRHGAAAARCGERARLPHHHRRLPGRRRGGHAGQPVGRPELWRARSEGEVPLMSAVPAALPMVPPARAQPAGFWRRLFRDKPLGAAGGVMLLLFLIVGLTAQWIAPYGFNEIAPIERLKPPSWAHWFGTDNLGRDVLSRCVHGAQLSVIIGCSAALLATAISALIGIVSGYAGGRFDLIVQRFVDAWQSFPDLIILIVVVSVIGPGMLQIIGTLALLLGIAGSRIVRSAVISVREHMYVHASQSIGASVPRILWRHILPNVMAPIIVLFTT